MVLDVALAHLAPEAEQVFLVFTLVREEEDVGPVEGVDCLDGDVLRVARPDPDDAEPSQCTDLSLVRLDTGLAGPGDGQRADRSAPLGGEAGVPTARRYRSWSG
jgi:hypothetical protein